MSIYEYEQKYALSNLLQAAGGSTMINMWGVPFWSLLPLSLEILRHLILAVYITQLWQMLLEAVKIGYSNIVQVL